MCDRLPDPLAEGAANKCVGVCACACACACACVCVCVCVCVCAIVLIIPGQAVYNDWACGTLRSRFCVWE